MFPCSHGNISFQRNEEKWRGKKKGSEGNIENLCWGGGGGQKGEGKSYYLNGIFQN
jgi:hypothetical protein